MIRKEGFNEKKYISVIKMFLLHQIHNFCYDPNHNYPE